MENNIFEKKNLTQNLRILSDLLLRFDEKLQQSCQNLTLYAKPTFRGKTNFLNKSLNTEFFSDCEWKVSAGFFKQYPTFSEEVFQRKDISFQKIMSFPGYCRQFFRIFGRNVLARCSKLHFKRPEEHDSWKKLLFENVDFFSNSDLEQILYESFVATFGQLRDHYNPSVHRNILKK